MKTVFNKNRVEAFSDGIFAIIITLLVLEIKVPHLENHASAGALSTALFELFPKFISWIISFFTVAVIWVNHHKLFKQFRQLLRNPGLLEETTDIRSFRQGTFLSLLFGPLLYLAGIALSLIHPYVSFAIFLAIPVYFIFAENKS